MGHSFAGHMSSQDPPASPPTARPFRALTPPQYPGSLFLSSDVGLGDLSLPEEGDYALNQAQMHQELARLLFQAIHRMLQSLEDMGPQAIRNGRNRSAESSGKHQGTRPLTQLVEEALTPRGSPRGAPRLGDLLPKLVMAACLFTQASKRWHISHQSDRLLSERAASASCRMPPSGRHHG